VVTEDLTVEIFWGDGHRETGVAQTTYTADRATDYAAASSVKVNFVG